MATSSRVVLSTESCGVFHLPHITPETAGKASDCLQENHDEHHCFFNAEGFHNHIAHHLLTLYALGASADQIQRHYDNNKGYQRPPMPVDLSIADDLEDGKKFRDRLGNEKYYHDFLVYFQRQMDEKGWQAVVNDVLFKGDERANNMLVRLHAGFLHPIIHLGFGIEFGQPAIIAEALAQTAVHDDWIGRFLLPVEKASASVTTPKSLVTLLDEIRVDSKLKAAAHWEDGNKIRDGILVRAPEEMIKYASQWKVGEHELETKTAEMVNAAAYFTAGAQHPPKIVKYDFYYMHCLNASIFYSAFLEQAWISDASKAKLLEWKGRIDLAMYASRRCPEPLMDEIVDYKPKNPQAGWDNIFERVKNYDDDGHAAKLVRALAHGEQICKGFEGNDAFRIKANMWLKMGHTAIDSVEGPNPRWVRSAGFDEAWEGIEERPRAQL